MPMLHSNGGCLLATLATQRPVSSDRASSVPSLKTSGKMESCSSLKDRMARRSGLKYTSLGGVLVPHGCSNWRFLAVLLQSKLFAGKPTSTLQNAVSPSSHSLASLIAFRATATEHGEHLLAWRHAKLLLCHENCYRAFLSSDWPRRVFIETDD